jgi:hypothetical protein
MGNSSGMAGHANPRDQHGATKPQQQLVREWRGLEAPLSFLAASGGLVFSGQEYSWTFGLLGPARTHLMTH